MRQWIGIALLATLGTAFPLQAQETGVLTLSTELFSEVFWQGIIIGFSDSRGFIQIRSIPLGIYSILVVKDGFQTGSTEVKIHSGDQQRQITLVPVADSESVAVIPQPTTLNQKKVDDSPAPASDRESTTPRSVNDIQRPSESRFNTPAVTPTPADTESDFTIVLWWGLGLAVLLWSLRLFRK